MRAITPRFFTAEAWTLGELVWPAASGPSTLATAVGPRTPAMAQRFVPQVAQGLAPGWVPLFLNFCLPHAS